MNIDMINKGVRNVRKSIHRLLSLLLCVSLLLSFLPASLVVRAEGVAAGTVIENGVRVRKGPGTNYDLVYDSSNQIIRLNKGHQLTIEDRLYPTEDGQNYKGWYKATFTYNSGSYNGYVCADYVSVTQVGQDNDFESQIAVFPEDYKPYLRALHEKHPSWRFEALDTGFDWQYVQDQENVLGRSLTDSRILSYRSTAAGCYDWSEDRYIAREGSSWFQAAPAVVAYYMDPRNFLNEEDIFQFEKLTYDPNLHTVTGIETMLANSYMSGTSIAGFNGESLTYAQTFASAAAITGASAFHLVARCIQENGRNGTATSVCGTVSGYEGIYNFFNIGANTGAMAGLNYAKNTTDTNYYLPWNSQYKSILGGAKFISERYIGKGQNTLYLQKFSVAGSGGLFWHQYMTNITAARNEGRIMMQNYESLLLLDNAFTFSIPVYRNMPGEVCKLPEQTGSPNNLLKNLSVSGYNITPSFDMMSENTSYNLIIDGNVSSVTVNAIPVASEATLSGNIGNVPIKSGVNALKIYCTAASGAVREYTITVVLNGQGSSGEDDPPVQSGFDPVFTLTDTTVSGITPGMSVQTFISQLGLYGNASAYVAEANGNVAEGIMATGQTAYIYDGTTQRKFSVIIYGDVNGDGALDVVDLLMVRKNILGQLTLSGTQAIAADVNRDGTIDVVDLLMLRKHILGQLTIQ